MTIEEKYYDVYTTYKASGVIRNLGHHALLELRERRLELYPKKGLANIFCSPCVVEMFEDIFSNYNPTHISSIEAVEEKPKKKKK